MTFVLSDDAAIQVANLFADIPGDLPEELFGDILNTRNFRLERIVSRGHASEPDQWYDQTQHEWVILLSGSAEIEFDDQTKIALKPGDHINIPAHCRHRVMRTDDECHTVWLAIHYD